MPIVNKGVFEVTDLVYERQLGNDWPTVTGFLTSDVTEASSNLYYTNARVQAYLDDNGIGVGGSLAANTTTDLAEGDNLYYTNARVQAYLNDTGALSNIIVDVANLSIDVANLSIDFATLSGQVIDISNWTTSNINEGDNLYYTNARVLAHLADSNVEVKSITTTEAGTPTITSVTSLNLTANSSAGGAVIISNSALRIKSYTTTDRGNLTPATGDVIYNTTDSFLQVYNGTSWANAISDLSQFSTTDLAEGDNLYYTNARVDAYINDSITTDDVTEGTSLYYTNARVLAHLAESDVSVQDITVQGNLVVQGDTTTLNTATLIVEDKNIVLANGAINAAAANGAGINVDGAQANITYNSTGDKFEINKSVEVQGYSVLTTNNTTTDLAEGTNLYYTNARVDAHVATLGYITVSDIFTDISSNTTTDLAEGANLYYTNTRVQSFLDSIGFDSASNIIANVSVNIGMDLSANTTDDLTEGNNLYYTNTRVQSYLDGQGYSTGVAGTDLSSNTTTDLAEGNNLYYTNARVEAHVNTLSLGGNIAANTTTDLAEGNNLYYTNARARTAYTAGSGIDISENGVITSTDDSADFNLSHDGHKEYRLTSSLSNAIDFTSYGVSDSGIMRSMHLTNISDNTAYFSGNIVYDDGNAVVFANCMPIPAGTSLEMLKRPQIFRANDTVNLQGFDNSLTPTSNLIDCVFTYETVGDDSSFKSKAKTASVSGTEYEVANAETSFAIIESVKLINLQGSSCKANVYTKNSSGVLRAYLGYRTSLPPNSSLELLQGPKKLNQGDRLHFDCTGDASIIISYREGDVISLSTISSTQVSAGSNLSLVLNTTVADGTTIYYTIT